MPTKNILALLLFSVTAAALLSACKPVLKSRFISREEVINAPKPATESTGPGQGRVRALTGGPCYEPASYIPDERYPEHTPLKTLRINFHYMFPRDSMGLADTAAALQYTKELLWAASGDLTNNQKMWLPQGNNTPVLPIGISYVLSPQPNILNDDGIYFHYDDDLCYYVVKGRHQNNYNRKVIERYAIGMDSIVNFFVIPHHPDSVASPTYKGSSNGIALGHAVKLAGYFRESKLDVWHNRQGVNHELGHVLGLVHAWHNDGCDDTPVNPNCWNRSNTPPCDTEASNNIMDYNAHQAAWSPCQIGKLHYAIANDRSRERPLAIPTWCHFQEDKTITIRDTVDWPCQKDLEGNLIIAPGGMLTVNCRLSIPPAGKITVQPGGSLVLNGSRLHNACGKQWQGIEVQQEGRIKGEVLVIGDVKIEDAANLN